MLTRFKVLACTTLAAVFVFLTVGSALCCPGGLYQPELPRRD